MASWSDKLKLSIKNSKREYFSKLPKDLILYILRKCEYTAKMNFSFVCDGSHRLVTNPDNKLLFPLSVYKGGIRLQPMNVILNRDTLKSLLDMYSTPKKKNSTAKTGDIAIHDCPTGIVLVNYTRNVMIIKEPNIRGERRIYQIDNPYVKLLLSRLDFISKVGTRGAIGIDGSFHYCFFWVSSASSCCPDDPIPFDDPLKIKIKTFGIHNILASSCRVNISDDTAIIRNIDPNELDHYRNIVQISGIFVPISPYSNELPHKSHINTNDTYHAVKEFANVVQNLVNIGFATFE